MLTEEKRGQLDGIVKKMISNGESEENIQFVVDDFKQKYEISPIQNFFWPGSKQAGTEFVKGMRLPLAFLGGATATAIAPSPFSPALGGAVGERVGRGIESLLGVSPPETPIEAAKSTGIDIGLGLLPFGLGKMKEAGKAGLQWLRGTSKLERAVGGFIRPEEAGRIAQKESWDMWKKFTDRADWYYNLIPVKPDQKIITKNLTTIAEQNMDELGRLESPIIKKILGNVQTDPSESWYTWQELRKDISELGKIAVRSKDMNRKRILKDLIDAAHQDIDAFSRVQNNPEIKNALAKANDFYRTGGAYYPGVQTWYDNQIMKMMNTTSPEDIVRQFFINKNNVSDIARLQRVAGDEGFQALKQAWVKGLLGGEGEFNAKAFREAYNKIKSSGNLDIILTSGERKVFDQFYKNVVKEEFGKKVARYGAYTGATYLALRELRHIFGLPVYEYGR